MNENAHMQMYKTYIFCWRTIN